MKIDTYKIPIHLKREADGSISHSLDDSAKTLVSSEQLSSEQMHNIAGIAQKLGAENEKTKMMIKKTLLSSEKEANTHILIKILS